MEQKVDSQWLKCRLCFQPLLCSANTASRHATEHGLRALPALDIFTLALSPGHWRQAVLLLTWAAVFRRILQRLPTHRRLPLHEDMCWRTAARCWASSAGGSEGTAMPRTGGRGPVRAKTIT